MISRSIDIEDAIRTELAEHLAAYCAPLPAEYTLPNILVTATGGDSESTASGRGKVDRFIVVLDARAETEAEAMLVCRNAVAILEASSSFYVSVNSLYSWTQDPVRPDLAMCSATITATAHREDITL